MILRSQSKPQPSRSKPISIRDIMRDHDEMIRSDERILPPGLSDPPPQYPPLQPQAVARQALKMGMPIYPPSHIQSQTSVQLSDYHNPNTRNASISPRRIRIFDINSYHGRNYRSPSTSTNPIKNAFSFGDQIGAQPYNQNMRNQIQNSNPNPIPSPNTNQNHSKSYSLDPSLNQNRSSEIFQTVRSIRKTTDPKNNTIYEQVPSNKQQSGISLRSNKNASGVPGIHDSNSFSNSPILKQTMSQYAPPVLQPKRSTQYESIKPQSMLMSEKRAENSSISNPLNTLNSFSRSASPNPPVPVYENEFYKVNRSGDSIDNRNASAIPSYQAFYSRPMSIPQTPNFQNQTPYLDALLQDFNQFEARQRSGQRNMFQQEMPNTNTTFNNVQHPYAIQQALSQSFGQYPNRPTPTLPTTSIMNSGSPPLPPLTPATGLTLQPILQPQQNLGIYDRQYDPVNQMIAQQAFSQPQPQHQMVSLSPFQQNQREQLRQIPKRFEEIQRKVFLQQKQINQINRKLVESKSKDEETQKNLLGQLIQKQQELNQKQREINSNLDRISKMQNENNHKKQQILQYQLQLQRAKRVEELAKQNERLYHDIIRKENSSTTNTRDMSLPSQPLAPPQYYSQLSSPQPTNFRNEYSNRSISPQQAQRFDQIWESDGGSAGSLLSPFAINPDYY